MTINSVDSLVASIIGTPTVFGKVAATATAAGVPFTPWLSNGITPAGAAPTGGLNGTTFTATGGAFTGAISMPAAAAGETSRIARLSVAQTGNVGMVWLIDRIWGNVPVVTTTTGQAVTSPTWPARDVSASTNGAGVLLALECSAATGNAGAISNTTVTYTNSAGTGSRTASLSMNYPAGGTAGTWVPLGLQAGDVGVKSVQAITLGTSYVSGQVHLMAYRLIASIPTPLTNTGNDRSFTSLGLPTVWDNSVLQLVYWISGTAVGVVAGDLTFAQG